MLHLECQPHIQLTKADARPVVITVGDSARAESFAKQCESYKELKFNREYRSFCATHKGVEFLIISHGVGSAGAAICFRELAQIGVKCIIRAGTCGSLQPKKFKHADLCIAYAAAKEDGVTKLMEPEGMPAVATPCVVAAMCKAAVDLKLDVKQGVTVSSDLFYGSPVLPGTLETWVKAKTDIVEMEVSALYTICRLYDVACGSILAVDGCPLGWDETYDPTSDKMTLAKKDMARVCFETVVELTKIIKTDSLTSGDIRLALIGN